MSIQNSLNAVSSEIATKVADGEITEAWDDASHGLGKNYPPLNITPNALKDDSLVRITVGQEIGTLSLEKIRELQELLRAWLEYEFNVNSFKEAYVHRLGECKHEIESSRFGQLGENS